MFFSVQLCVAEAAGWLAGFATGWRQRWLGNEELPIGGLLERARLTRARSLTDSQKAGNQPPSFLAQYSLAGSIKIEIGVIRAKLCFEIKFPVVSVFP